VVVRFHNNDDLCLNPGDTMTCDSVLLGLHSKTIFVFVFLQTNKNVLAFFSKNQCFEDLSI
jgi:hypothetical protein